MRLDHIAIVVEDITEALNVYQHALGLPLIRVEDAPAEGVKVAFLPLEDGSKIELLQPTVSDTGVSKFLAKHGEGIHHLCVEVEDIEQAMAAYTTKGLRIIEDTPRTGSGGQKYVFVHPKSTHGVLIELYEKSTDD